MKQNIPDDVKSAFDNYSASSRKTLLEIRRLILNCAAQDETIGQITETLKWGEPAYLTEKSRSGSTIRLGSDDHKPDCVAVYFNCQTTLVKDIQSKFPDVFECENNRVLYLSIQKPLPKEQLSQCLTMALRYHLNKKQRTAGLL